MFGIGPLEIAVIVVFALIFVGPSKLPELARQVGRIFVQIKRTTADVRGSIDDYMREAERNIIIEEREKIRKLVSDNITQPLKQGSEVDVHGEKASSTLPSDSAIATARPAPGQGTANWENVADHATPAANESRDDSSKKN